MYSWSKDWPTLTEIFFGKGNGPQGPLKGMTKGAPKAPQKDATKDVSEKKATAKKKELK